MKIIATNTGSLPVALPGTGVTVGPGQTKTARGQSKTVAAQCLGVASRTFMVQVELDPSDRDVVIVDHASPADPAGAATVVAGVGFTLKDAAGNTVAIAERLGIAVYDDANYQQPSTTAYLDTATTGSIVAGSGTSHIEVLTAGGVFACSARIPVAATRTVYFKTFMVAGGTRVIDTSDSDAVNFTP